MSSKTCPRCKLVTPASAQWCDCGHVFDPGARLANPASYSQTVERHQADQARRQVRRYAGLSALLGWVVGLKVLGPLAGSMMFPSASADEAFLLITISYVFGFAGAGAGWVVGSHLARR